MNVIITNKYQGQIQGLGLDVIKELNGEFEIEQIISTFQNFFYQRMILDITAIKDYSLVKNLQKLSISLDMEKLILFFGDVPESDSNDFLSKIISMGIYNFTKNTEGVMYLYNTPNTYRDVAQYHQLETIEKKPTASVQVPLNKKIIGIENLTTQAGASTLIYILKKALSKNYSVACIEVNKRDFTYFNDTSFSSTNENELFNVVNSKRDHDIIFIDTNGSPTAEGICNEVIYLIEPSIIKLNKMMSISKNKIDTLKNKTIILNKSMLSSKDVLDFEYESKIKIFFNIPPLDDRKIDHVIVNSFLQKLGFIRQEVETGEKKSKLLGLFNI